MSRKRFRFDRVKRANNCDGGRKYTTPAATPNHSSPSTPSDTSPSTPSHSSFSSPSLCNKENSEFMKKGKTIRRDIGGGHEISIDCLDGCLEIVKVC